MLDTIELSKKLISFESVTPAKQDIFDFLIETFKKQGFTTKQLNFDGDGSYEVINLMATFGSPNTNAKHFNFLCHVDVVPPGNIEDWDTHPFEPTIKDGYLYGRGSEDMKGCTAASMVSVFKFLKDNPDFNGTISFIITGDEEADSINGVDKVVNWLQENNIRIDGSIATESSSEKIIGDQIKVGRKGAVDIHIEIIGKQGHAAYPQLAQNPVHCMSKIISFFDDQTLDNGAEYFEPSSLQFTQINLNNKAKNVIPEKVITVADMRFNDNWDKEKIQNYFEEHLYEIKKRHKLNLKYAILGNGPELSRLKDLVMKYNLINQVDFLESYSSTEEVYKLSKIHVMPTITTPNSIEGFGISNIEAASKGLPCVVSNSGGTPESIHNNGIIVSENNIEELIDAILQVVKNLPKLSKKSLTFAKKFKSSSKIKEYLNCI